MKKLKLFAIIIFACSSVTAQTKQKDTLYFGLDGIYVFESKYVENTYVLEDSNDIGRGTFFFEKIGTESHIHPKEILCLKKYVQSSKHYDKHKKVKLNDYRLWEDLNGYTIYLVKMNHNKIEYIHVQPNFEIE